MTDEELEAIKAERARPVATYITGGRPDLRLWHPPRRAVNRLGPVETSLVRRTAGLVRPTAGPVRRTGSPVRPTGSPVRPTVNTRPQWRIR